MIDDITSVDETLFRRMLLGSLLETRPAIRALAKNFGKPVFALPRPFMARRRDEGRVVPPALGAFLREEWEAALAAELNEAGALLLPQPADSIVDELYSRDDLSRGSKRVRGESHEDDDCSHLNAEYGAMVIRDAERMAGIARGSELDNRDPRYV